MSFLGFIGGRGLATALSDEVKTRCKKPLHSDNKLIFATGTLTGSVHPIFSTS
ncbi:MAG: hypothetical protein AEth_00567 [Candidatus Argoarchaeum ethanivorans]|uniref:Aldehyde ferredoxin oxidoreductase N-terminal domain-containing protein n=1 Tax=Candidatus Argoarchaeum ethanivorans TaxID=2608793 RepID=A0A8B3S4L1_9EURY|nr:MAG: hypothetical protein AEth_00567 [Candidatus Argoarchaeum ethanivorans]